ncbi:MAG: hypothetical protein VXX50_02250 [Candidatus Thermoplasmatota archaeon]|nr:hypothetical protein [Candidatus Thermoplasmatota archaeon]
MLSLPILWVIDWRFTNKKIRYIQSAKLCSYYVLILLLLIVIQGIIGHYQDSLHRHAILWGVSDSIIMSLLHFSYGPEGRLIFIGLFYWTYTIVRKSKTFSLENTIYSIPLLPIIGVGTSGQSFAPVTETIVSSYAPVPTVYPFIFSLLIGITLGEVMFRSIPLITKKKITINESRFVIILWTILVFLVSYEDSITSLLPFSTAFSLIFFSSIIMIADIIGGYSETFPQSKGETWPSLAFSFFLISTALLLIYFFAVERSLLGIGVILISATLGSQLPNLGFDNRNRSAHRWCIFGVGIASLLLITFDTLDDISIKIMTITILIAPMSWNIVDRYLGRSD